MTEALIVHLLRQAYGRNHLLDEYALVVTLPPETNEMERHAIRKSCGLLAHVKYT